MPKSGVEHLANHPGWKTKKKGVWISYSRTSFRLSAAELWLIADAAQIINPEDPKALDKARKIALAFEALAEYAESVE